MDSAALVTALYMLGDTVFSADGEERRVCIAAAKKIDAQSTEIVVLKTMVDVAQQELLDEQNKEVSNGQRHKQSYPDW